MRRPGATSTGCPAGHRQGHPASGRCGPGRQLRCGRAIIYIYKRGLLKAEEVATYESLADPKLKGKPCSRSGAHPYNLSLVSSLLAHDGEAKTEAWARAVVAHFARPPQAAIPTRSSRSPPASARSPSPTANTWQAARRNAISPTATMSGPSCPAFQAATRHSAPSAHSRRTPSPSAAWRSTAWLPGNCSIGRAIVTDPQHHTVWPNEEAHASAGFFNHA